MSFDFSAAIAEAASQTNMNEAVKGGGDGPRLPDAGLTRLRLISYIELGTHYDEKFKKNKKEVVLQFELSGPKHAPLELEDGRKIPFVISVRESVSLNEKANFYKLFRRMNHTGEFTHMAQMLGREFLGTVVHAKNKEDEKIVYANLRDDGGYTIRPPFVEDVETGESRRVEVSAPINPQRCFIFDYATKEMWDSLFIDGRWDDKTDDNGKVIREGRSKNIYQERIRAASDFDGSPIANILSGIDGLELGEAEKPPVDEEARAAAAADPLESVG